VKGALVDPSRVTVEGYGDAQPIATNATAAGKSQNAASKSSSSVRAEPLPWVRSRRFSAVGGSGPRWVALLLILVLAVLLPLVITPMRPLTMRLLLTAAVVGVWVALSVWIVVSARMKSDRLAKELAAQTPSGAEGVAVAERMKEALAGLKNASGNRRDYLYSRPWYIIIGPPGAGKTTSPGQFRPALPFSETALKAWAAPATSTSGSRTRPCWWTPPAATRPRTSDAERDGSAWQSFMNCLKTNRPQQAVQRRADRQSA